MGLRIVFETHSTSEDNERGIGTGWLGGRLSETGRRQAAELGARRRTGIDAVYASDLRRAVETAEIAFGGTGTPVFLDWRLRECDYGERNGTAAAALEAERVRRLDEPWPGGESWRQAVARVGRALDDLRELRAGGTVLVIGHIATRWALEHRASGTPLEELAATPFRWQPGWEYVLDPAAGPAGERGAGPAADRRSS